MRARADLSCHLHIVNSCKTRVVQPTGKGERETSLDFYFKINAQEFSVFKAPAIRSLHAKQGHTNVSSSDLRRIYITIRKSLKGARVIGLSHFTNALEK